MDESLVMYKSHDKRSDVRRGCDSRSPAGAFAVGLPMRLEHIAEIDSTNSELMRRALRAGARGVHGLALVADRQHAGRGQRGRIWRDRADVPGASLLMSLGWHVSRRLSLDGFTLSLGLTLIDTLAPRVAHPAELQVKWPNDLLYRGGKCGGILVESLNLPEARDARIAIVGIGLNLTAVPPVEADAGAPSALPASALWPDLAPDAAPARRAEVLSYLLPALGQGIERFVAAGFAAQVAAFDARLAWRGDTVEFRRPDGQSVRGRLEGVAPDGALRLSAAGRTLTLRSGEVRRAAGAHPVPI